MTAVLPQRTQRRICLNHYNYIQHTSNAVAKAYLAMQPHAIYPSTSSAV